MRGMTASVPNGMLGVRLRDTAHRGRSRNRSGTSMVNVWLTSARQPGGSAAGRLPLIPERSKDQLTGAMADLDFACAQSRLRSLG